MKSALSACAVILLASCVSAPSDDARPAAATDETPLEQRLEMTALADNVWMHTSWAEVEGFGPYPSNGLIIAGEDGAVLVDTAWSETATNALLDWSEHELGVPVRAVIVTHAHDDRMSGLSVAHARGAESYGYALTAEDAVARGLPVPEHVLTERDTTLSLAGVELDAFHPGGGHTRDNIVVSVEGAGVVFGGCLIRAAETSSIGNTADAVMSEWAGSALAVGVRFPDARIIVPGHGAPGDPSLLDHTAALARSAADRD